LKASLGCIFSLDICAWGNKSLCPCASQVDRTKDTQEHGNFDMFCDKKDQVFDKLKLRRVFL
jgi:hypothetical protein